jgi:hypothetical protein
VESQRLLRVGCSVASGRSGKHGDTGIEPALSAIDARRR